MMKAITGILVLTAMCVCSCDKPAPQPATQLASQPATKPATQPATRAASLDDDEGWVELFDGETLKGWTVPEFGGDGDVEVRDGAIQIGTGYLATGIKYTGNVPRENYEVELEGQRVEGTDFWCALTFPVGKGHVSLVLGGWGGSLVGISCIDGMDASENATTEIIDFENGRWYTVRVRVTEKDFQCFLDDKKIIEVDRFGKAFDVRLEVEPCIPQGIATWQTHGAIRGIRMREIEFDEDE